MKNISENRLHEVKEAHNEKGKDKNRLKTNWTRDNIRKKHGTIRTGVTCNKIHL